jgi:hypothetical protein
MICRFVRRQWAHMRALIHRLEAASTVRAFEERRARCAIAAQLRAQIPCSTDPARLERLAREAEARARLG